MNTQTAILLAHKVSELTELVTHYEALFGRRYKLSPESPPEAHQRYQSITNKQLEIAALLDQNVSRAPARRWFEWWRWQDVMDNAITNELAIEANHLIACCAYAEVDPHDAPSPILRSSQEAVAGMLHPDVYMDQRQNVVETDDRGL